MVDHREMKAYLEDLRQKVVRAVYQCGTYKSEAARLFGISLASAKRYTRLAFQGESLTLRICVSTPICEEPKIELALV